MPRPFHVDVSVDHRRALLTLEGELDLSSSPELEVELERLDGNALVVIDLRGLEFIDSTGLGVLVKAHQRLRDEGNRLGLIDGEGQVRRLLALTGLADELNVAGDPDELLADR